MKRNVDVILPVVTFLAVYLMSGYAHCALAEEDYAAIGFPGALPPSAKKFSFKELRNKVLREAPPPTTESKPAPKSAAAETLPVNRTIHYLGDEDKVDASVSDEDLVRKFTQTYLEYEDLKKLTQKLPNGVSAQDLAHALAELRVYSGKLFSERLVEYVENLVRQSDSFSRSDGELDGAKLKQAFSDFDIQVTPRLTLAVETVRSKMHESAIYSRPIDHTHDDLSEDLGPAASKDLAAVNRNSGREKASKP